MAHEHFVLAIAVATLAASCKDKPQATPEQRPSGGRLRPGALKGRLPHLHGLHGMGSAAPSASAAAAPIDAGPPAPIDAALPANVTALPASHVTCDAKNRCDFSKSMFLNGFAKNDKSPVTIVGVDLAAGSTFDFPFFEGVSLAVVVLEGSAEVKPLDAPANAKTLAPWQGAYAPNGLVRITPQPAAHLYVVLGTSAGDPVDASLVENYKKTPAVKRAGAVRFVDYNKSPDLAWGEGAEHARIGWEANGDDKPWFVVDVLKFSPTAAVAEHAHDKQWEAIATITGAATLVQKTKPGDEGARESLEPGATSAVAPGTLHRVDPGGSAPLLAIQVYSPPGPEQRFKALATPPAK